MFHSRSRLRTALGLGALLLVSARLTTGRETPKAGEDKTQVRRSGAALFKTYCSSCHGPDARGDGPLADSLRYRPADLTRVAARNNGRFDAKKVGRIIDGRKAVKGHGGPEMPVWGDAFKRAHEGYSNQAVQVRIRRLVEHLESIQEKKPRP